MMRTTTKYFFFLFLFFAHLGNVVAQPKQQRKESISDTEKLPFKNEFYMGLGLHTRGWNVSLHYGFIKTRMRTMQFIAEFGQINHPKQKVERYNASSIFSQSSRAFVYGKRNTLYTLRLGYGEKRYLSSKENNRAVSLAWTYGAGISLGLVRPYYLDLIYRNAGGIPTLRAEKYGPDNWNRFLDIEQVDGPSGGEYGWDEAILEPGFFLKTGLLIDWGAFDQVVKGLEIGLTVDTYFSKIPLLVFEESTPVFVNLYVHVYLGTRW